MISMQLQGRLGNQLFQYAFAYAMSRRLGTSFYCTTAQYSSFLLPQYFKLRHFEEELQRFSIFLYTKFYKKRIPFRKVVETGYEGVDEFLFDNKANFIEFEGFFQSVGFFAPFQKDIKRLFQPKFAIKRYFLKKRSHLINGKRKLVVLHIRRTDYLSWGSSDLGGENLSLPMTYYDNCIAQIPDFDDYTVLVLGDDIQFAKDHFGERDNFLYQRNNEITDFLLLMYADLLIISNSTFAWWGAFLNKKSAIVFAPKFWLGFKVGKTYPVNIDRNLSWRWVPVG